MLKGEEGRRLRGLQEAFHRAGMGMLYSPTFIDRRPCCFLAPFDAEHRPCGGRKWEAIHFIGRQQVRNCPTLHGLDPELIALAEWDARNAGLGCVNHHRPFDSHSTPGLVVCREKLPSEVEEFIADWGLEEEAERKFNG